MYLRSSIVGLLCSVIIPVAIADYGAFTQRLDHFSDSGESFQQLYWGRSFVQGGSQPQYIFLYVGGEGPLGLMDVWTPFMEYCQSFGALCFALEHRFYGKSVPAGEYPANIQYLSSDQALEDIAQFIRTQDQLYPNAKWVLFGGSYAGTLSAWARQMYPNLVHAAIASSAPLEAQVVIPNFAEVYDNENQCERTYRGPLGLTTFSTRQLSDFGIRGYTQGRCWTHQVCNEFGWLEYQNLLNSECNGDLTTLENGINHINSEHHGKSFSTERVFFVHGSCDCWHLAGITESNNPRIPAFVIQGGGHCWDMYLTPPSNAGPAAIRDINEAQRLTVKYLSQWLAEPKDTAAE